MGRGLMRFTELSARTNAGVITVGGALDTYKFHLHPQNSRHLQSNSKRVTRAIT